MEEELGPPTMWGGDSGPWMLWRLPGTCLLVHTHDEGEVSLELLPPDADADAAGRGYSRGRWRAAEPAGLPSAPAAPPAPGTTWEEVEKRLSEALRSLGHDTPFFPGRFILHLGSADDPQRFVQCWSQDLGLVIEATGYLHQPDAADPARLVRNGWDFSPRSGNAASPTPWTTPRRRRRPPACSSTNCVIWASTWPVSPTTEP